MLNILHGVNRFTVLVHSRRSDHHTLGRVRYNAILIAVEAQYNIGISSAAHLGGVALRMQCAAKHCAIIMTTSAGMLTWMGRG